MSEIHGTLRPLTLARVRLLSQQIAALEEQRRDVFAFHLEGEGHDPNVLVVTRFDPETGAYAARPQEPSDAA